MKYLIRNCKIYSPGSPYNGKRLDLLIKKGRIAEIGRSLIDSGAAEITSKDLRVSIGWMDIGTHLGEPGHEHRETLESLASAALAGGYTDLVTMPSAIPAIQTKAQIQSLISSGKSLGVNIHPIGALSQDLAGGNITEFIDMHHAGAVAFSDGLQSINKGGLLLRALQYAKSFGGTIFHHPNDASLANEDMIHEGEVSTMLGMKGSPSLAESLCTYRDTNLNEYAESRLAIHLISTKKALGVVKNAKKNDPNLTAGVAYLNLLKTDTDLQEFDSNLKVKPILRSKKDLKSLHKGLADGTIDYISSNHVPLEVELKHLEYPYATHGAIGLETCFSALSTVTDSTTDLNLIVDKLTYGPRAVLGMSPPSIEVGSEACITIFDPTIRWTYTADQVKSTSNNSPFLGKEMTGKVIATFNKSTVYIAH